MDVFTIKDQIIDVELDAYRDELMRAWQDADLPPNVAKALACIHEHLYDDQLNVAFVRECCKLLTTTCRPGSSGG